MKRLSPILLVILVLTGCHAPMPSFNLLAPYGPTRIPPAATNSGAPSTYYQGRPASSTPPVGTGFRASQSSTSLSADNSAGSFGVRTVSGFDEPGRVTRATHQATTVVPTTLVPATTVVQSRGPIQFIESGAARTVPANVRGMHINDATVEPSQFYPTVQVIDIAQLPPASSVRYANVVPVNQAVGTSIARNTTSSRLSSRSSSTGGTGWQPRH